MFKKLIILLNLALFANSVNGAAVGTHPGFTALSNEAFAEFIRNHGNFDCSICLEPLTIAGIENGNENPNWPCRVNCGSVGMMHVFHRQCIERANGNLCPICRGVTARGADIAPVRNLGQELIEACSNGNLALVRELIVMGANINVICNRTGTTPLIMAAASNNLDIVRLLIENNANVNMRDSIGMTALMRACMWRRRGIVEFLIANNADASMQSDNGYTALMGASLGGDSGIVQLLITNLIDIHRADLINARDDRGWTALSSARISENSQNRQELIDLLILNGAVD